VPSGRNHSEASGRQVWERRRCIAAASTTPAAPRMMCRVGNPFAPLEARRSAPLQNRGGHLLARERRDTVLTPAQCEDHGAGLRCQQCPPGQNIAPIPQGAATPVGLTPNLIAAPLRGTVSRGRVRSAG
jgi:hypothetical protein